MLIMHGDEGNFSYGTSLYFDFHRITSSSRSSGDGRSMVYFILDEKLNLQCMYLLLLKCGGVKVLVNMVYVTSIP